MMPKIISRAKAEAADLNRYFTGKPCPNGHIAERMVRGFDCVICQAEKTTRKRRRAKVDARIDRGMESAKANGTLLDMKDAMDIFKTQGNAFDFIDETPDFSF